MLWTPTVVLTGTAVRIATQRQAESHQSTDYNIDGIDPLPQDPHISLERGLVAFAVSPDVVEVELAKAEQAECREQHAWYQDAGRLEMRWDFRRCGRVVLWRFLSRCLPLREGGVISGCQWHRFRIIGMRG